MPLRFSVVRCWQLCMAGWVTSVLVAVGCGGTPPDAELRLFRVGKQPTVRCHMPVEEQARLVAVVRVAGEAAGEEHERFGLLPAAPAGPDLAGVASRPLRARFGEKAERRSMRFRRLPAAK